MQTQQKLFSTDTKTWIAQNDDYFPADQAQLVLVFGHKDLLTPSENFLDLKAMYPAADIVLCSTAGEILGTEVHDGSLCLTAIYFEHTTVNTVSTAIKSMDQSFQTGADLAQQLPEDDLTHVMVFSDGLQVNGSELTKGLKSIFPSNIIITGGLAGDEANFKTTVAGLNQPAQQGQVILIGFYGDRLQLGFGSVGGWDCFGSMRTVTKADKNVVYELDHQPILDLYKVYLGQLSEDLPGSGLLFPLNITPPNQEITLVRTLLAVDEDEKSITFAGDVPEGSQAQLMRANFERIIDGAGQAAQFTNSSDSQLAILISCVGRKLVLKQRTEEEVESVQEILGPQCAMTGFYSYGEVAPTAADNNQCELHNQTMTITTFKEVWAINYSTAKNISI